ncbi:hypothetical protein D3C84_1299580 [compost metagenome]
MLAVTGRPCDTNTAAVGALELLTLDGVDDGVLELAADDCGLPEPVKDTAIVWLAEIALKV